MAWSHIYISRRVICLSRQTITWLTCVESLQIPSTVFDVPGRRSLRINAIGATHEDSRRTGFAPESLLECRGLWLVNEARSLTLTLTVRRFLGTAILLVLVPSILFHCGPMNRMGFDEVHQPFLTPPEVFLQLIPYDHQLVGSEGGRQAVRGLEVLTLGPIFQET